jgi:hypothetical protein
MTTEAQREQHERREVLRNDLKVKGTTLSQFAQSDVDTPRGRFTSHEQSTVVGASPTPAYPAGPAWCAADQGLEPALGYAIDELEPASSPLAAQPNPEPTPSAFDVERPGLGLSSGDPAPGRRATKGASTGVVGSPVPYRRY